MSGQGRVLRLLRRRFLGAKKADELMMRNHHADMTAMVGTQSLGVASANAVAICNTNQRSPPDRLVLSTLRLPMPAMA